MNKKKKKFNILIAEDEPAIQEILSVTLQEENYKTTLASNGSEAMEKMEKESVDAAVVDVKMPKMSGKKLISKIKEISQIPIIIVTGSPDIQEETELKKQVYGYIYKPFRLNKLVEIVKKALGEKHS